jgi:pimeloyl-ACP methyl ester carboxylesterase
MAPIPQSQWAVLKPQQHPTVALPDNATASLPYYELEPYNGKTLKFTIEEFGSRPEAGYALYIALHGGGGREGEDKDARMRSNNQLWYDMATNLYRFNFKAPENPGGTIDGALYVALRGVTDTWDLHFRPESYVLLERLIKALLQPTGTPLVDSNRIFLVGFSAGGDGVYRLATKLSDRFAAVNMSSGHPGNPDGDPNRVQFDNLANLPFCSQVGELDNSVKDRAKVVAGASDVIEDLKKKAVALGHYTHDCFVHAGGSHTSWERAEDSTEESAVYKSSHAWLLDLTGGKDTITENTNAINWMTQHGPRNPLPTLVAWNLESRPPSPTLQAGETWQEQRFFYWLYLRKSVQEDSKAPIIRAAYHKKSNSVWIEQPTNYIAILLNNEMLTWNSPDQPVSVSVYIGPTSARKNLGHIKVAPSKKIADRTFQERGDAALVFSGVIYFESKGNNDWEVKTADTLDVVGPPVKAFL